MIITSSTDEIRKEFPILTQQVNGRPLIYFDNGATVQKPKQVIAAEKKYYDEYNANIHRGVHFLSQKATDAFEEARKELQSFIGAAHSEEVIFTSGTTESINIVAKSFLFSGFVRTGDEILISAMEHHSNIVPWQMLCEQAGAKLTVVPFNELGELDSDAFKKLINRNTKLVAVSHISNALGTINPVKNIIDWSHAIGVPVLIDGAQAVPHQKVDVQQLDADFYCFSAHKMYGPTGVGVLYGKKEWLERMQPVNGGGEMIAEVSFEKTTYAGLPHKFEAGTPNIASVIAFGEASRFMRQIGLEYIASIEQELLNYATEQLEKITGLTIIGRARQKASLISFVVAGVHPYDLGTLLDNQGIAVRTGHHCAQPVMERFAIPGTVRASFAVYNTKEEIDIFVQALERSLKMLR